MYINDVIYQTEFTLLKKNPVSDHVKLYFHDLYKRYDVAFDLNFSEKVYDYNAMAAQLLQEIAIKNSLQQIDVTLLPQWGFSWDMQHSSSALHWKNQFKLSGIFQDVQEGKFCLINHIINVHAFLWRLVVC